MGEALQRREKNISKFDPRYRSMLQKAVRRGAQNLVITTSALLESFGPKEKNWLRKRAAVIAFEECWPVATDLIFNKSFHSKVAVLIKTARSLKNKDAAGLGSLAYALAGGHRSVLDGSAQDRDIKIVASGIKRPADFWEWIRDRDTSHRQRSLVKNAVRSRHIGQPHEKAYTQAAAYLAVSGSFPEVQLSDRTLLEFPYNVVFDAHTAQGKQSLHDIARDLHIPFRQLAWTQFYFESCVTNGAQPSQWWERYSRWRFEKLGIPLEEAYLIWEPAKKQLIEALAEDGHLLHKEIYQWKMANREKIASLKKKVALFIENFNTFRKEQAELF
jgi:hypothetical protein